MLQGFADAGVDCKEHQLLGAVWFHRVHPRFPSLFRVHVAFYVYRQWSRVFHLSKQSKPNQAKQAVNTDDKTDEISFSDSICFKQKADNHRSRKLSNDGWCVRHICRHKLDCHFSFERWVIYLPREKFLKCHTHYINKIISERRSEPEIKKDTLFMCKYL